MQNKEQSALLVHRENYIVPKGEEHTVHYKIAKLTESGEFIEQPRIVKSRVKLFESVTKRGLELNGYTVEILYHPNNTYSNVRIEDKNVLIQKQDAEIAALKAKLAEQTSTDKDAEIAALKAKLAEQTSTDKDAEIAALKAKLAEQTSTDKDAEIAKLKAKIEALKKKAEKEEKSAKGNKSDKDEKLKEE